MLNLVLIKSRENEKKTFCRHIDNIYTKNEFRCAKGKILDFYSKVDKQDIIHLLLYHDMFWFSYYVVIKIITCSRILCCCRFERRVANSRTSLVKALEPIRIDISNSIVLALNFKINKSLLSYRNLVWIHHADMTIFNVTRRRVQKISKL